MNMRTEDYHFNRELTLWEQPQSFLSLLATGLSLTWQDDQPIECHLTFQIAPDLYLQIEAKALFNLKPEIRGSYSGDNFQPDPTLQIAATLKPDRLPDLAAHITSAETTADYLLQLSQETPDHPLLYTENWLALSVKQQQASGEVGYTTLWSTLNPAAIAAGTLSESEITQSLTHFFSDWAEANLGVLTEKATAQTLNEIGNFFNDLTDTSIEAFAELSTELAQGNSSSDTLLSQIIHFFTEDDWSFTKLQGEPVLRTAFQGENGKWVCYARAREEQQQFVFYSICPIDIPKYKRFAISEFLTRANYGMTIGNFELDFTDGEVRYKTSIDVEGDRLSHALIKHLVYINVTMMDEYLPGIIAVIEDDVLPNDAIQEIEQSDSAPAHQSTESSIAK